MRTLECELTLPYAAAERVALRPTPARQRRCAPRLGVDKWEIPFAERQTELLMTDDRTRLFTMRLRTAQCSDVVTFCAELVPGRCCSVPSPAKGQITRDTEVGGK
jgi:hypothetical protein